MIRVYNDISRLSTPHSASPGPLPRTSDRASLLTDALVSSQSLLNLWTTITGCANSGNHLSSAALKFLADSISRLVLILATAFEDTGMIVRSAPGQSMVVDEAEAVLIAFSVVIQVAVRRSIIQLGQILVAIEEGVIQEPNTNEQVRPLHNLEISALMRRLVPLVENVQAWGISRGRTQPILRSDKLMR